MHEIIVVPGRSDVFDGIEGRSKVFFDTIIRYLYENVRPLTRVLICGGPTSRHHPDVSEAEIIWEYFREDGIQRNVWVLKKPLTTNEIFRVAKEKLDKNADKWGVTKVTVFHEAPSWLKVRLLTWIILRPWGKYRTKVIPVRLNSPWKVWLWQLTIGMADVVFALIPPLERVERRLRLRQIAAGG